jgi:hypothetical protein
MLESLPSNSYMMSQEVAVSPGKTRMDQKPDSSKQLECLQARKNRVLAIS